MFDPIEVKTAFAGLMAWRQNIDPNGVQLITPVTPSTGLYYNEEHPLLTIDNLASIAPDVIKLTTDETGRNTLFTDWLNQKTEAAILKALTTWYNTKLQKRTAKNLLDRNTMLKSIGSLSDTIDNEAATVGLEIKTHSSISLVNKIEFVGLHLDTAETVEVSLFHQSSSAAISTVTTTGTGGLTWMAANWSLSKKGTYYIVYNQPTTAQAINGLKKYDADSNGGYVSINKSKYMKITPFKVDGVQATMWDVKENEYTKQTNYGLNIKYSTGCDYTSLIVEQKDLFVTLIRKQVAADMLRHLPYNSNARTNRNESNIDGDKVLYEIDGDARGRPQGIGADLKLALDAIQFDESGIDKICLPCKRRGMRIKAI